MVRYGLQRSGAKAVLCGMFFAFGLAGCGASGPNLGAVNTLPGNASAKARDHAERCDEGEVGSCRWLGIWYSIGGGGNHRKLEGRRFLRWGCDNGDRPSCTLIQALARGPSTTAGKATPQRGAPSGGGGLGTLRGESAPAPQPQAGAGTETGNGGALGVGGAGAGAGGAAAEGAGPCESGLPAGTAQDLRETAQRCDSGNMTSCNQIGVWYLKGGAGSQRIGDGARWLKHACDRGHEPSCALVEELRRRLQEMKDQGKI